MVYRYDAGLPANKAAAVLAKLLADHKGDQGDEGGEGDQAPAAPNFDARATKEQWKELSQEGTAMSEQASGFCQELSKEGTAMSVPSAPRAGARRRSSLAEMASMSRNEYATVRHCMRVCPWDRSKDRHGCLHCLHCLHCLMLGRAAMA